MKIYVGDSNNFTTNTNYIKNVINFQRNLRKGPKVNDACKKRKFFKRIEKSKEESNLKAMHRNQLFESEKTGEKIVGGNFERIASVKAAINQRKRI